jgi:hypothetical protein
MGSLEGKSRILPEKHTVARLPAATREMHANRFRDWTCRKNSKPAGGRKLPRKPRL